MVNVDPTAIEPEEFEAELENVADQTRERLYDEAMGIGGVKETPLSEWIDTQVEQMRSNRYHTYEVSDAALAQVALEAAADAVQAMADEGYAVEF